ncbi:MAG: hypothetical protein QOH45_300 [Pseudonocardiales bacterium]|jgi:hypothetical protein|nr:hypothetical protein [Pseudonocardiales bacterium]
MTPNAQVTERNGPATAASIVAGACTRHDERTLETPGKYHR